MPTRHHEPAALTHSLTISQYVDLGETRSGYTELLEGSLLLSPSPGPAHSKAMLELAIQLNEQASAQLQVVHAVDIDLELAPPDGPGSSRRPDLIMIDGGEVARVDAEGGIVRASAVHKRRDYADAGIPWYWIVDISEPVSLVAYHRNEEHQRVSGTFTTREPFPVTIDLDRLR